MRVKTSREAHIQKHKKKSGRVGEKWKQESLQVRARWSEDPDASPWVSMPDVELRAVRATPKAKDMIDLEYMRFSGGKDVTREEMVAQASPDGVRHWRSVVRADAEFAAFAESAGMLGKQPGTFERQGTMNEMLDTGRASTLRTIS